MSAPRIPRQPLTPLEAVLSVLLILVLFGVCWVIVVGVRVLGWMWR